MTFRCTLVQLQYSRSHTFIIRTRCVCAYDDSFRARLTPVTSCIVRTNKQLGPVLLELEAIAIEDKMSVITWRYGFKLSFQYWYKFVILFYITVTWCFMTYWNIEQKRIFYLYLLIERYCDVKHLRMVI